MTHYRDMRNTNPSAVIRWEDTHKWADTLCCMCWEKATVRANDGQVYCKDHKPEKEQEQDGLRYVDR